MKNIFFLTACFVVMAVLLSACQVETNSSIVKTKRRLEQFIPQTDNTSNASQYIDLSEGLKLKYNSDLGPKDLDFEVKINNPY